MPSVAKIQEHGLVFSICSRMRQHLFTEVILSWPESMPLSKIQEHPAFAMTILKTSMEDEDKALWKIFVNVWNLIYQSNQYRFNYRVNPIM